MNFWVYLLWIPTYIFSIHLFIRTTEEALTQLQTTNTGGNGSGGWLARLGWGLGEASVEVLEPTPSHVYEARIAFFGRAIPEDGLTGWLVPLDSLVGECPSSYREATASGAISSPSPSISGLPPPFTVLDPAYTYEPPAPDDADMPSLDGENTGCPPLCPLHTANPDPSTPFQPFPNTTWIALVLRGTCSFAAKAFYAQSLGASAMIVGGLDDTLISMSASGGGTGITLASVFVGSSSYHNLTGLIDQSGVRIGVTPPEAESPPPDLVVADDNVTSRQFEWDVQTILVRLDGEPPWEWYTPILSLLLILSLPSILTLCTLFIHRIRAERREREMRAPEDIVAGLPIRIWTGVAWEKDLERGRALVRNSEDEHTERSPLLPVRSVSKEGEREYGSRAAEEGEPSTSAPRGGAIPISVDRNRFLVREDEFEGAFSDHENSAPQKSKTTGVSEPLSPTQEQHQGHQQEDSEESIPRPPWFNTQSECAICLSDFEVGDRVRVLPCGHIFHIDEVDPWLIKQRKVCPVCKYDVTNPPTALVPASSSPDDPSTLLANVHPSGTLGALETEGDTASVSHSAVSEGGFSQQPMTAAQMLADVDQRHRDGQSARGETWTASLKRFWQRERSDSPSNRDEEEQVGQNEEGPSGHNR